MIIVVLVSQCSLGRCGCARQAIHWPIPDGKFRCRRKLDGPKVASGESKGMNLMASVQPRMDSNERESGRRIQRQGFHRFSYNVSVPIREIRVSSFVSIRVHSWLTISFAIAAAASRMSLARIVVAIFLVCFGIPQAGAEVLDADVCVFGGTSGGIV